MVVKRQKRNWIFYIAAIVTILSAVYTTTLNLPPTVDGAVRSDLNRGSLLSSSHSLPESASQSIHKPVGILVIDQIVRAGKSQLHNTVIRSILSLFFLILIIGCLSIGMLRILFHFVNCIRSRSIIISYIHQKDGEK